jgi:hypothetical protein
VQDTIKEFILSKTEAELPTVPSVPKKNTHVKISLVDAEPDTSQAALGFDFVSYLNASVKRKKDVPGFVSRQPKALQDLYFAICCIPAASCDIERLFSTCGYIDSPRRGSLTPERLEQRVLLKKNNMVVKTFKENQMVWLYCHFTTH